MKIILSLAAVAVLAAGCTTAPIDPKVDLDSQGKVWRGLAISDLVTYTKFKENDPSANSAEARRTGLTADQIKGMRTVFIKIEADKGVLVERGIVTKAVVPDSIATQDIKKGAIFDLVMERGSQTYYPTYRINRVVKMICRAEDSDCIRQVKANKTLGTIVDPNAGDGQMFGQTYQTRISREEHMRMAGRPDDDAK